MKAVRRWFPTRWPYVWRQGLANLYRPANQTAMVILALGFGAFLLDTVYLVQHNLLRDLRVGGSAGPAEPRAVRHPARSARRRARPDAARGPRPRTAPVPIVPMRIASVKGATARRAAGRRHRDAEGPPRPRASRTAGPCGASTAARIATPSASSERVVAGPTWAPGSWKPPHPAGEPVPISRRGGTWPRRSASASATLVTWDVQGVDHPHAAWPACARWNGRASSRTSSSCSPRARSTPRRRRS